MKNTIELIIKWLKESGLNVNDEKTGLSCFYFIEIPITFTINDIDIISSTTMNVSKLNWQTHIQSTTKKSK